MAAEMERMFGEAEDSVEWDSGSNQIKCYAHKLAVTVKDGLKVLNLTTGHTKPTTEPGVVPDVLLRPATVPSIVIEAPSDDECEPEDDDPDLAFEKSDDQPIDSADWASEDDDDNDQLTPPQLFDAATGTPDDILPSAVCKVLRPLLLFHCGWNADRFLHVGSSREQCYCHEPCPNSAL